MTIWTSTLKRAIRTAQYIPYPKVFFFYYLLLQLFITTIIYCFYCFYCYLLYIWFVLFIYFFKKVQLRGLDDLDRGDLDGKTPDEIAREFPQEYSARIADKLVFFSFFIIIYAIIFFLYFFYFYFMYRISKFSLLLIVLL